MTTACSGCYRQALSCYAYLLFIVQIISCTSTYPSFYVVCIISRWQRLKLLPC